MESAEIRSIAFLQLNLRVFLSLGIWWSGVGKRSVLIHIVCFAQFVCALPFSFHCLLLSFFFFRCGSMYVGNISRIIFSFLQYLFGWDQSCYCVVAWKGVSVDSFSNGIVNAIRRKTPREVDGQKEMAKLQGPYLLLPEELAIPLVEKSLAWFSV